MLGDDPFGEGKSVLLQDDRQGRAVEAFEVIAGGEFLSVFGEVAGGDEDAARGAARPAADRAVEGADLIDAHPALGVVLALDQHFRPQIGTQFRASLGNCRGALREGGGHAADEIHPAIGAIAVSAGLDDAVAQTSEELCDQFFKRAAVSRTGDALADGAGMGAQGAGVRAQGARVGAEGAGIRA